VKFTSLIPTVSALRTKLLQKTLSEPCPHCSKQGTIRRHGFLRGKDLHKPTTIERGLRFFCSNRYSNKGCARTFSIFFDSVIPRHSVSSRDLGEFLRHVLEESSIHAAWTHMKWPFSISSAYRWINSFKENMARIRPHLHERNDGDSSSSSPLHETIRLLSTTFPLAPVSQFQSTFQSPIFF